MIGDSRSCVSKSRTCIVSKRHDTNILDILREEVLEPEGICLAVGPSLLCISVKAMDGYKAIIILEMSALALEGSKRSREPTPHEYAWHQKLSVGTRLLVPCFYFLL